MSNPKNLLQEHFQGLGLDLPTYDTGRAGGEDHRPSWVSQVRLHDGQYFVSEGSFTTKSAAEKSAAKVALREITGSNGEDDESYAKIEKALDVLIDVENMSRVTLDLIKKALKIGPPERGIKIVLVMSKGCSLLERIRKDVEALGAPNITIAVTNHVGADAADMYMCLLAQQSVREDREVWLVTNDRFAHTFVEVARDTADQWKPYGRTVRIFNIVSRAELWRELFV